MAARRHSTSHILLHYCSQYFWGSKGELRGFLFALLFGICMEIHDAQLLRSGTLRALGSAAQLRRHASFLTRTLIIGTKNQEREDVNAFIVNSAHLSCDEVYQEG